MKSCDVTRFEEMYDQVYDVVSEELRNGRKESHWMWFIFPQIAGLGFSDMSIYYAIWDLEEAREFLRSSCGPRMESLLGILLELETADSVAVFGAVDAVKLCSSMTLFDEAEPANPLFRQVLDKFYQGKKDERTMKILEKRKEK